RLACGKADRQGNDQGAARQQPGSSEAHDRIEAEAWQNQFLSFRVPGGRKPLNTCLVPCEEKLCPQPGNIRRLACSAAMADIVPKCLRTSLVEEILGPSAR